MNIAFVLKIIDHCTDSERAENVDNFTGPPIYIVQELDRQLETWRLQLPSRLQWTEADIYSAEDTGTIQDTDAEAGASPSQKSQLNQVGAEILAAELRARFYYAQFILGRPFIFKALHFAEFMNDQDAEYCAQAIRSACLWPAVLSPARHQKRLLPHLFTWTQNFIAILTILWMSRRNDCLGQICREKLDEEWVERMVGQMLFWIKDIKQIDNIAEWSWHFLQPLFSIPNHQ